MNRFEARLGIQWTRYKSFLGAERLIRQLSGPRNDWQTFERWVHSCPKFACNSCHWFGPLLQLFCWLWPLKPMSNKLYGRVSKDCQPSSSRMPIGERNQFNRWELCHRFRAHCYHRSPHSLIRCRKRFLNICCPSLETSSSDLCPNQFRLIYLP